MPRALNWWSTLSLVNKQAAKKYYEENILNGNNDFPNLKDTTSTRISKLTANQIRCI